MHSRGLVSGSLFCIILLPLALPTRALGQGSVDPPRVISGRLEAGDLINEAEQPFDQHRLTLKKGERIRVQATSSAFDTVLTLSPASNPEEILAQGDDVGTDINARMTFTAGKAGEYLVNVISYDSAGSGEYELRVDTLPPLPNPISKPTASASIKLSVFEGSLMEGDAEQSAGFFDDYKVTFRSTDQAIIRLKSAQFDPVIQVFRLDAREGNPLVSDHDAGGPNSVFLVFSPPEPGEYIVRVTSYGPGAGPYRLEVGQ